MLTLIGSDPVRTLASDLYTRDALQGFGQVAVRELTDVFRGNRIADDIQIFLDLDGVLDALADSSDDDLLEDRFVLSSGLNS